MLKEAVFHQPFGPYAYAVGPKQLCIRLRAKKGDLRRVTVLYADRYSPLERHEVTVMERAASDKLFDYYEAVLALPLPRFRYLFHLEDDVEEAWYSEGGFLSSYPMAWHKHFQFPYISTGDLHDIPEWAADTVWYEIFPERFANGSTANDPPGCLPWTTDARPTGKTFFGGDLEGIIARVPYLAELGVTGLYLTPVFLAPSTHKYDTTDYMRIDPQFGDEATARALVDACHAAGIRVVLDAVFNHCGYDFFAFADVRRRGAESLYADWFVIHDFPVRTAPAPNYETWGPGIASLPKLRTDNPAVQDYLLGVARHWMERLDIDGWRLDAANEADREFWRRFRKMARAVKPDVLIVGEIMHRAQPWLAGDQFDGVMNYPFWGSCLDFFAKETVRAAEFDAKLAEVRMAYPDPVNRVVWNLLNSHDTARFLTAGGADDAVANPEAGANAGALARAGLAMVFQYTYVGAPMIYYGDEIGMEGGEDPDCRRPMRWDVAERREDVWLFGLHRQLAKLRREWSCLRRGNFRTVLADSVANVYVFRRRDEVGEVLVALNNGPHEYEWTLTADRLAGVTVTGTANGGWQMLLEFAGLTGWGRNSKAAVSSSKTDSEESSIHPFEAITISPYGAILLGRRPASAVDESK